MSDRNVNFHRIESYELQEHGPTSERSIICSFNTQRHGFLQIAFDEGGMYQLKNEPDLNMFRDSDRKYIENSLAIAWRMVFDTPAKTERFE